MCSPLTAEVCNPLICMQSPPVQGPGAIRPPLGSSETELEADMDDDENMFFYSRPDPPHAHTHAYDPDPRPRSPLYSPRSSKTLSCLGSNRVPDVRLRVPEGAGGRAPAGQVGGGALTSMLLLRGNSLTATSLSAWREASGPGQRPPGPLPSALRTSSITAGSYAAWQRQQEVGGACMEAEAGQEVRGRERASGSSHHATFAPDPPAPDRGKRSVQLVEGPGRPILPPPPPPRPCSCPRQSRHAT